MNLSENNEWLWNLRCTNWWFKTAAEDAENMPAPCMHPGFSGIIDKKEISDCVKRFSDANINMILTEGLRRLMLFEREGKTDQVNEAIKEATEACHREGIKVVHHMTMTFVDQDISEYSDTHRKWLSIDAQTGRYAYTNLIGGWYFWCINNPDFRAEYFRLSKKLLQATGVDGLMVDEVYFRPNWYACACPHCQEKYKIKTGFVLPAFNETDFWGNFDNPAFRAWIKFRIVSVGDFYEDLYAALKEVHLHPVLLGCKNDEPIPSHSQCLGDNNEERMRGINMLFMETGAPSFLYSWRRFSFNFMAYNGYSNYYGTPTLAIMYNSNPHEGFIGWAMRVAHGVRIWATSGNVVIDSALSPGAQLLNSPVDMELYRELFGWEEEHKDELNGAIKPLANIAVLLSASTRDMADHGGGWNYYVRELVGWGEALTDEFIQYAVIVEQELTLSNLRQYALVILPNAACLSDEINQAILEYVALGGNLIFTNETGSYDETGSKKTAAKRLDTFLGINGKASLSPGSVLFGKYELGKWVYFSHKPGVAVYTTSNELGKPRRRDVDVPAVSDEEQTLQKSLMMAGVRWAVGNQYPLVIKQAAKGLLIKAFKNKDNKAIVIHILNCRGEDAADFGEIIPEDYPVENPPLENDIIIELCIDSIKRAYLFSPDWNGEKEIKAASTGDKIFQLNIPKNTLKRYEVLYILKC